jgi:hypothetical protein
VDTPASIAILIAVQMITTGKQAPPEMVDKRVRMGIDIELV